MLIIGACTDFGELPAVAGQAAVGVQVELVVPDIMRDHGRLLRIVAGDTAVVRDIGRDRRRRQLIGERDRRAGTGVCDLLLGLDHRRHKDGERRQQRRRI